MSNFDYASALGNLIVSINEVLLQTALLSQTLPSLADVTVMATQYLET